MFPTFSMFHRLSRWSGDEIRPTCGQCLKRREQCRYDDNIKIIRERPGRGKERAGQSRRGELFDTDGQSSTQLSGHHADDSTSPLSSLAQISPVDRPHQVSLYGLADFAGGEPVSSIQHNLGRTLGCRSPMLPFCEQNPWSAPSPQSTFNLQYADAIYLQHFAGELGRWLDCTDAARQFTMKIPNLAQHEEPLLRAVACFAARHMRQTEAAARAHEECVRLLIPRLTAANVASDDAVLCSIVILRVFEQLDGKCATEIHQAGSLINASQLRKAVPITRSILLAARHCCNPLKVCR